MNEQRTRARYGRPAQRKGPPPTVQAWNFTTDDLITSHIQVARRMAWHAWWKVAGRIDVTDMVGDALYGLTRAGRTFDPERRVPFEAWAVLQIRRALWNGVRAWTHGHQRQPPQCVPLTGREVA